MSRPPNPQALFSLVPICGNKPATGIVAHSQNRRHASTLPSGVEALDDEILIYIEGDFISRIQCSFETDLDTGAIMLYDRSTTQSTQVLGENAVPFEQGRVRKVLAQKGLNTRIGMGGERQDLIQFELVWHGDPVTTAAIIKNHASSVRGQMENPRLARTVEPTDLPSRRAMRPHTPGQQELQMRYVKVTGGALGSGQFGQVYKAINVDSGKLMAVKILKRPTDESVREVEALSNLCHPRIIDFILSQGWGGPRVEIFMGLKEGTLRSLVESVTNVSHFVDAVCSQMLQALDYIAVRGVVHRDVKPENILYISQPDGQYRFQLGDFGVCGYANIAKTRVGSELYMAPEVYYRRSQTPKLDVWSLFVSMLWTLNVGGFRWKSNQVRFFEEVQKMVLSAAFNEDSVSAIREMAILNPEERASAAQMLVKCFNGEGLSTPPDQVPALTSSNIAAARALPSAPPSSKAWIAQTGPRGRQTNANTFAAAARYRARSAGGPLRQ